MQLVCRVKGSGKQQQKTQLEKGLGFLGFAETSCTMRFQPVATAHQPPHQTEKSFVMVSHRGGLCFVSERRPQTFAGQMFGLDRGVVETPPLHLAPALQEYRNRVLRKQGTQLPFQHRLHDRGMFFLHLQVFFFYEHTRRRRGRRTSGERERERKKRRRRKGLSKNHLRNLILLC